MRKCTNCDTLCPDSEKYCKTCGQSTVEVDALAREKAEAAAAVQSEKLEEQVFDDNEISEPKKKKSKALLLGIAGVLALVAAIAAIVLIPKRQKSDPMRRFFDAQESFVENKELVKKGLTVDSLMSGEYKGAFSNISTDAELTLDVAGLDLGGMDIAGLNLSGFDVSEKISKLSLFFQILNNDKEQITGLQLRYSGSPLISATMDKTENGFGIYLPELSEKRYELTGELFAKLMSAPNEMTYFEDHSKSEEVKFNKVADLKASYKKLKSEYEEIFYKGFVVEDFTQTEGSVKLEKLGREMDSCREITYKPNAERLTAMLSAMAERIRGDKELSDHILSLMEHYLGESGMRVVLDMITNSGEIELGENGLIPVFEKIADELNNGSEEAVKKIMESNFTWRVVTRNSDVLAQYLNWDKGSITFEKLEDNAVFEVVSDGSRVISCANEFETSGDKKNGKIIVKLGDENTVTVAVTDMQSETRSAFDVPYGRYDVSFGIKHEGESAEFGALIEVGKAENGGTDHRISFTGLEALGDGAPERLAFCLNTTDTASTAKLPTAETVRVESEEQLESITEELGESLGGIVEKAMLLLLFG